MAGSRRKTPNGGPRGGATANSDSNNKRSRVSNNVRTVVACAEEVSEMPPLTGGSPTTTAGSPPVLTTTPEETLVVSPASNTGVPDQRIQQAVVQMHEQDTQNRRSWRLVDLKMISKRRARKKIIKITKFPFGKGNDNIRRQVKAYLKSELGLNDTEWDLNWPSIRGGVVKTIRGLRTEYTKQMKMRYYCTLPCGSFSCLFLTDIAFVS